MSSSETVNKPQSEQAKESSQGKEIIYISGDNEGVIQTLYIRLLRRGNVDKIVIFSPLAPVYKLPNDDRVVYQNVTENSEAAVREAVDAAKEICGDRYPTIWIHFATSIATSDLSLPLAPDDIWPVRGSNVLSQYIFAHCLHRWLCSGAGHSITISSSTLYQYHQDQSIAVISGPSSTTYPQELAQSQSQSPHFRVSTVSADQSVVEIQRPHRSTEHKVFAIAEAILEIIANDKSQNVSLPFYQIFNPKGEFNILKDLEKFDPSKYPSEK